MRWNLLVDEIAGDLRTGVRQIARNPGFTAIAVLTLALGIGANTALFSIFNSLILRPLPVRDPGNLVTGAVVGLVFGSWSSACGGAAAVLVAVGVLAAWLPAHRAARLDPVTVLREG